jgi:hypothetical protein
MLAVPKDTVSRASFTWPDWIPAISAWKGHGPFAFWLIEQHKPRAFVELGTHYGYSYFCFCQAVKNFGTGTKCFAVDTWRGDEHAGFYDEHVFNEVRNHNENRYAGFSELIRSTFDEALEKIPDRSVDLLHIDGRHYYEDVKHDYETWKPKLSTRGIVLFHDTQEKGRNFGVHRLWDELKVSHPHFEFHHSHGLGVLAVGEDLKANLLPIFELSEQQAQSVRAVYERLGNLIQRGRRLSRNELCPCGSQEKYKNCHGALK